MQLNTDEIRRALQLRWWWPLAAGVLFGIAVRVIYSGRAGGPYNAMMGSFALLVPIGVAALTVFVAELQEQRTWAYYFWMSALANVLFTVGTFVIHIEGLICVILAAPMFAIIGGVAGLIVGAAFRGTKWLRRATYCCALLPLFLGSYEHYIPLPQQVRTIERTITVAAPRWDVWDQLMTAEAIRPDEMDDGYMYQIGVPLPESALAGETDDGRLVRHIRMGRGIEFDQIATDWQACSHVRWQYHFTANSFPPRALDDHVRIGGEYFDVLDAQYSLRPIDGGRTALRVTMSYRVSTRFNWYAQPVAKLIVGNFEETALRFYARRAEAQAARSSGLR
ncbi:MAG TPA: hypothetical protein VL379_18160 [Pseudomonadales bacterium]|jgi:hypothetical protein|nr:hypothetical protein [Pseudomonadales bacterium]